MIRVDSNELAIFLVEISFLVCVFLSRLLLQRGILKFCGLTEFASGHWAGIALVDSLGKNDGSVAGIRYFDCEPEHGRLKLFL